MENVDDVLIAIAAKIREIVRLVSIDVTTNRRTCLTKVDSCLLHLNNIRSFIPGDRFTNIMSTVTRLRDELLRSSVNPQFPDETSPIDADRPTSYNADRSSSGKS